MASAEEMLNLAAQYRATGNLALAEQLTASVVAEEPDHAAALHLLGLVAQQKGMLHDAMAYLRRSLTANGSNAVVWQHAGDVLFAQGDFPGGITYYEQALRLRPDFAEGHNTLGVALMRAGKLEKAVVSFQQARRLAPSFAQALNNLGVALNKQGKWAEAAAVFEEARKLRPDSAEVVYNLGNARFFQGSLAEAIACYRRALDLRPADAAEVLSSLAAALQAQGHWDEAIAHYREVLRLRPGHVRAIYSLSEMASQGRYVFPPEELGQLKEILITGRCGEEERRLYTFAVANVHDSHGAFDEAFRYYREANDLLRAHFKKRKAAFDANAYLANIDKIMSEHGPSHFEKVNEWRTPAEAPVFIVGMPCSGAALVEEMLSNNPKVSRVGEAGSVLRFLAPSATDQRVIASTAQLLPDLHATQTAAANYLRHLAQLSEGATRVLVSSLDNVFSLGLIATLFSGVRVIHCRREAVDAGLACYCQNRHDLAFACSLEDIAAYSRGFEKLMAHWTRVLPLAIREVDYEALVHDREKTARELLVYSGLDWDERCAKSTPASGGETSGRWRHYRAHLGPLIRAQES